MSNQLSWMWKWSLRTIPNPGLAPGIGQGLIPSCLWDVICVSGFPCQQSFLTWIPMPPDDSAAPMAAHNLNLFKEICQSRDGVETGGWEDVENPRALVSAAYSQTLPVTEGLLCTQNHLSLISIGLLSSHNRVTSRLKKVFQTIGLLPADLRAVTVWKVLGVSALAVMCGCCNPHRQPMF